ncbi:MAG: L,D-transpeptidase [Bauldia sp.]|nr:MAG: L,D-transpeptidase [Bauldia sp.]MBZ0227164.1 L,D-transpeptidase [Bauldia sp.]
MNTFGKIIAAAAFAATLIGVSAAPSEAGFSIFSAFQAGPKITATVSISQQTMVLDVTENGVTKTHVWKVSTGKTGFETPTGAWKPTWLSKNHKSKTYDNAPMPFAVFFTGGYAIHATDAVARLGKPASHGCVRLSKENAAAFFALVQATGKWNTRIVVTN